MNYQEAIERIREHKEIHFGKEPMAIKITEAFELAISAMEELQQYWERIEQLRHTEVIQFRCKLPDGRICHFTDFIDFLEKGEVD